MFFEKKYYILLIVALIILISTCKKKENKEFNIETDLISLDIKDAKALLIIHGGIYYEFQGQYIVPHYLLKLTDENEIVDVNFTFSSQNNYYQYQIFPVNKEYFLITYYHEQRSYLINKKSGEAQKIKYILPSDNWIKNVSIEIIDTSLFYINYQKNLVKTYNYLDTNSIEQNLSNNLSYIRHFYLNSDSTLIFTSENNYECFYMLDKNYNVQTVNEKFYNVWKGIDHCIYYNSDQCKLKRIRDNKVETYGNLYLYPYCDMYFWNGIHRSDQYNKIFGISNRIYDLTSDKSILFESIDLDYPNIKSFRIYKNKLYIISCPDTSAIDYWSHDSMKPSKLTLFDITNFSYLERIIELDYEPSDIFYIDDEIIVMNVMLPCKHSGNCKEPEVLTITDNEEISLRSDIPMHIIAVIDMN